MGNSVGSSNGDIDRQSSFTVTPPHVVPVPELRNSSQFRSSTSNEYPNSDQYISNFPPNNALPSLHTRDSARVRLDVQQTCVVKNIVNLRKNSICVNQENTLLRLSFVVDASVSFRFTIYYLVYEKYDYQTNSLMFTSSYSSDFPNRDFDPSLNTKIITLPSESLDLSKYPLRLLMGKKEDRQNPENSGVGDEIIRTDSDARDKESTFDVGLHEKELHPIVIELKAVSPTSLPPNAIKRQCTYAKLVKIADYSKESSIKETSDGKKKNNEVEISELASRWKLEDEKRLAKTDIPGNLLDQQQAKLESAEYQIIITKQKIQFENKMFEVQEIFGIERSAMSRQPKQYGTSDEDMSDLLSGIECVICLAEERNTAVLPCRHMCLCSGCANIMRMQSNKCPICRQTVTSLLQISTSRSVENVDQSTGQIQESSLNSKSS